MNPVIDIFPALMRAHIVSYAAALLEYSFYPQHASQ